MSYFKQEKGGTYILVLLITMLLSIMVISLVGLFSQTDLVSRQAAFQEKAYTDADSLIRLTRRSMQEVVPIGLSAEGLRNIIDELQSELFDLNSLSDYELDIDDQIAPSKVIAKTTFGHGTSRRNQTIELGFSPLPQHDADLGTGGGNGFGNGAGGTSQLPLDHPMMEILQFPAINLNVTGEVTGGSEEYYFEDYINTCSEDLIAIVDPPTSEEIIIMSPEQIENYNTIYNTFVNKQIEDAPKIIEPIISEGYKTFNDYYYSINHNSPQEGFGHHGSIHFVGNGDLVIEGDLIVKGNLILDVSKDSSILINGDLIIGGNFDSYNELKSFAVTGTMSVRYNATFQNMESMTIGLWNGNDPITSESLIAGGSITVSKDRIPYSIVDFKVSGNVSANTFNQTAFLKNLTVGGTIFLRDAFNLSKTGPIYPISSISIGGSLYARNSITFNSTTINIDIKGDFLTNGHITINHDSGIDTNYDDYSPNTTFFKVGGAFGALRTLTIAAHIYSRVSFGGYYIGERTTIWLNAYNIGYNNQGFCITHSAPGSGSGGSGGTDFTFEDIIIN